MRRASRPGGGSATATLRRRGDARECARRLLLRERAIVRSSLPALPSAHALEKSPTAKSLAAAIFPGGRRVVERGDDADAYSLSGRHKKKATRAETFFET